METLLHLFSMQTWQFELITDKINSLNILLSVVLWLSLYSCYTLVKAPFSSFVSRFEEGGFIWRELSGKITNNFL